MTLGEPTEPTKSDERPRRPLVYVSLSIAIAAWLLFIAFQALHRPADPMLWILTAGWPFYYGFVLAIGLGIMSINEQGPSTSRWPKLLRDVLPRSVRRLFDLFYAMVGPTALVLFPLAGLAMGALMLYLQLTGQANRP